MLVAGGIRSWFGAGFHMSMKFRLERGESSCDRLLVRTLEHGKLHPAIDQRAPEP